MSVVIATYRRPLALRAAVQSLVRQSRPPQEIVVVRWAGDVDSQAAVGEIAQRVSVESPEVAFRAVVVQENTVQAKENAGMRTAAGDIVCFMDDDAAARPDWLARIERHYADPTVGAVGGRDVVWKDGCVQERQVRRVGQVSWIGRLVGNHHERSVGVRDVDFLKGCNMSFRKEVLDTIDPRLIGEVPYGFEIDLGLAVRSRGRRILFDPEVVVDHYPSSDMSAQRVHLAYVSNHNQTYVLLKHLNWPRKLVFLAYTFLVGDKNTIGALRVPWLVLRAGWQGESVRAHFAGKVQALGTYWSWQRGGV